VVEDLASGADKRLAGEILLVAGLLAHQHELSAPASFARDGLGCVLIERTTGARVLGLASSASDLMDGTTSSSSWDVCGTGALPRGDI
jgi:hypothetical protein